jgi:ParB/RepB/Spo0J family partition protein
MAQKSRGLGNKDLLQARQRAEQQRLLQGASSARVDQLLANPENGRKELLRVEELAETLKTDGMSTAITVVPPSAYVEKFPQHREYVTKSGKPFVVIHGHRRLAAAQLAGLEQVPILIRENVPSIRVAAIQENLQRMGLNPIEEGEDFQGALVEERCSQRELAKRVGCSQTYVSHRISLLKLIPDLREAVVSHWLKEQGIQPEDDTRLLPVREAATVYARLREDLQHAFVDGNLSAEEAAVVCKMPLTEQAIPAPMPLAGAAVASDADPVVATEGPDDDCGAITANAEHEAHVVPQPRNTAGSSKDHRADSRTDSESPSPQPHGVPAPMPASAAAAPEPTEPQPAPSSSPVATKPRAYIPVGSPEEIAVALKQHLTLEELDALQIALKS